MFGTLILKQAQATRGGAMPNGTLESHLELKIQVLETAMFGCVY